jgi:uncharacterized membrane protein
MDELRPRWHRVKSSLWFFPGILTGSGVLLALLAVRIDESLNPAGRVQSLWLFGGGAEGARGVLSAIASTTVTVAGTVFSIVVVALQLASSQFTPRVLQAIMRDRGNQITLGAFIGTFTYSLLVLRSVRSGTDEQEPFIPALSVTIAILLALICMALLIFFIHHAARSMEAATVIARATHDAQALVDRVFPDAPARADHDEPLPPAIESPVVIQANRSGYLATVNVGDLVRVAEAEGLVLRVEPVIGDFVLPGTVLAVAGMQARDAAADSAAEGDARNAGATESSIRRAFTLLDDPSEQDDLAYNVQRLADIAVKAMSPGINDPTTAKLCIDRLSEVIGRAGMRPPSPSHFDDDQGMPRVLWRHDPWERMVVIAFDQTGHYSASDLQVMLHLSRTLERIASAVPAGRSAALRAQGRLLAERGEAALATETERALMQRATAWARA